jgi:murein DD-endopeptidase MepM/ murein hydrolase activator NlpD
VKRGRLLALVGLATVAALLAWAAWDRPEPVEALGPVRGLVIVTNSPRDQDGNGHRSLREQGEAWDLVPLDDRRDMHAGAGERLEDWPGFGRTVRAPVDGEVVQAVDDVADRAPHEDPDASPDARTDPAGNHVLIETAGGAFVLVAHLRRGAVRVDEGDRVAAGEPIGEVGNSGRTTGPHVHLHAQHRRELYSGRGADAVPIELTGCRRIGRFEHDRDGTFHTWHGVDVATAVSRPRRGDVLRCD